MKESFQRPLSLLSRQDCRSSKSVSRARKYCFPLYKIFLRQGFISHEKPLHKSPLQSRLVMLQRLFMPDLLRIPGSFVKNYRLSIAYIYF